MEAAHSPPGAALHGGLHRAARSSATCPRAPRPRPPTKPAEPAPIPRPPSPAEGPLDPTSPFAVELGRGAVFDGGFAAGARRDAEGGAVAIVATVGADGKGGRLVKLGRSRGDLDPPVVTGAGASVLAVLIEPNAGGRSIKIAKVTGADVTWGPELSEGRDESLAVDVAASGARAVVVWDDLSGIGDAAHSSVMLASFDVATMRSVQRRSAPCPRRAPTPAPHASPRARGATGSATWSAARTTPRRRSTARKSRRSWARPSRRAGSRWCPSTRAASLPGLRAPSPRRAAFTSSPSTPSPPRTEGNALVAVRDDDTPTGSSGGKVSSVLVRLGGGADPRVLVEEAGAAGAPDLLPGWISSPV